MGASSSVGSSRRNGELAGMARSYKGIRSTGFCRSAHGRELFGGIVEAGRRARGHGPLLQGIRSARHL